MRSILVIRLSSLGDVILSTPIVRQLSQTYPQAAIDVAVASRFSEVYSSNPRIRHVWSIDPAPTADNFSADEVKLAMRDSVPGGEYDLVVDLQHNVRSAALRHGLGHNVALAPKHRLEKLALVWLKKKPAAITPIVSRYRAPLEHLPLTLDTSGPEFWLPEERVSGSTGRNSSRKGLRHVALAPGAQHATKRWPAERFGALAQELVASGVSVSLVGGPADVQICNLVEAQSESKLGRYDGARTIEETARILDECDAIVTNDSGVMHLASARQVPIVAVFGSTTRDLGFAPYGVRHVVVEHDVSCRPCSHIGRSKCPKRHFACMLGIEVGEVMQALEKLTA